MNDEKTHVRQVLQERFDFLGYTFGRCHNHESGRTKIGTWPSKKNIQRIVEGITQETDRRLKLVDAEFVVEPLNRKLNDWANCFWLGPGSPAYQVINTHITQRLRRWLCKKHEVPSNGRRRYPDQHLHEQLVLVNLPARAHDLPWAKAPYVVREPGAGNPPVRFGERDVEARLSPDYLGTARRKRRK